MAKKCEQCGAPAVDAQSLFCNLCGGYVQDEPETTLSVCQACGIPAPDDQSVFCTRCGLKFAAEPEDRYPVCTSCGSIIPDEQAVFCNRCGTKVSPGPAPAAPVAASGAPVSGDQDLQSTTRKSRPATGERMKKKAQGSVIITKKKQPAGSPAQGKTPFPGALPLNLPDDRTEVPPDPQVQKKYAHLPLIADEGVVDTTPTKKYAYLPLVAEELKVKDSPQGGFLSNGAREPSSPHQKKHTPKNGIMGMFKR